VCHNIPNNFIFSNMPFPILILVYVVSIIFYIHIFQYTLHLSKNIYKHYIFHIQWVTFIQMQRILFVLLQISKESNIGGISQSTMNRLKKKHHLNENVQEWRLVFTKCIVCESFKDLISKLGKHNNNAIDYEVKLKKHILHQEWCENLYHTWRTESMWSKDEYLCIIHDKMDHAKSALPRLQVRNKMISSLGQLPVNAWTWG
jgi:hypothetical protein